MPPSFFVDAGLTAASLDAEISESGGILPSRAELANFMTGGPWDIQRVGTDRVFVRDFTVYSTIGIDLYGAAAGIPEAEVLATENTFALFFSHFDPNLLRDPVYTNLPAINVQATDTGYRLYQSGLIGPTHSQ